MHIMGINVDASRKKCTIMSINVDAIRIQRWGTCLIMRFVLSLCFILGFLWGTIQGLFLFGTSFATRFVRDWRDERKGFSQKLGG